MRYARACAYAKILRSCTKKTGGKFPPAFPCFACSFSRVHVMNIFPPVSCIFEFHACMKIVRARSHISRANSALFSARSISQNETRSRSANSYAFSHSFRMRIAFKNSAYALRVSAFNFACARSHVSPIIIVRFVFIFSPVFCVVEMGGNSVAFPPAFRSRCYVVSFVFAYISARFAERSVARSPARFTHAMQNVSGMGEMRATFPRFVPAYSVP